MYTCWHIRVARPAVWWLAIKSIHCSTQTVQSYTRMLFNRFYQLYPHCAYQYSITITTWYMWWADIYGISDWGYLRWSLYLCLTSKNFAWKMSGSVSDFLLSQRSKQMLTGCSNQGGLGRSAWAILLISKLMESKSCLIRRSWMENCFVCRVRFIWQQTCSKLQRQFLSSEV